MAMHRVTQCEFNKQRRTIPADAEQEIQTVKNTDRQETSAGSCNDTTKSLTAKQQTMHGLRHDTNENRP